MTSIINLFTHLIIMFTVDLNMNFALVLFLVLQVAHNFFCFVFFFFRVSLVAYMEVPRLGAESEL